MTQPYTLIGDLKTRLADIPADSIISQALYSEQDVRVVLFRFAVGQELTQHTASQPAILYFVEGRARLTLGTDEHEAGPGTWAHMAANLPHSIYAETPVTLLLILVRCAEVQAAAPAAP